MNLSELLPAHIEHAEKLIYSFLPSKRKYEQTVVEAMGYSLKAGGKRLRPIIIYEVCKLFLKDEKKAEKLAAPFMAAIEMVHTYSLVHDDLPAMDNDTLRRGMPTTWAVYGDGMAVLTGDALLNYAYETALSAFDAAEIEEYERVVKAIRYLADKSGINGMIGGQVADVEAEKKHISIDADRLLYIHRNKTGALLEASFVIGGILGGATEAELELLSKAALNIGVAFQIEDDILDVVGNEEVLGKNIGSDEESGKETYVTLFGFEKAKEDVDSLSQEALLMLDSIEGDKEFLIQLVKSLVDRDR